MGLTGILNFSEVVFMDKKIERTKLILEILMNKNGESIKNLSAELNVSEMTIRRDIQVLSEKNLVTLIQGVVILNQHNNSSIYNKIYDINNERTDYADEKLRIGKKASSLLEHNDVIIIDTGTTTEQLADFLPSNLNLTVICYNLNILMRIKDKTNRIIFAGGHYHENTQMFQSPEGVSLISRTCANKAFVSAAGISSKLFVTCTDQYETNTKKAVIEAAMKKILLVDSSKFDKICPVTFANLSEFNTIITDGNLSNEWIKYINDLELELLIV